MKYVITLLIAVCIIFCLKTIKLKSVQHKETQQSYTSHTEDIFLKTKKSHSPSQKQIPVPTPLPVSPISPPEKMSFLLKKYSNKNTTLQSVFYDLKQKNMNPILNTSSNPYTGTMHILRTNSPLSGTRYFHAQYFSDKKTQPYLQHMSFELKPETNAFENSILMIKKIFPELKNPTIDKKDFILWHWKNGFNVWIQKLSADQLAGDPYNAYEASDAGTIKVAIELDIGHEDEHNH